MKKSAYRFIIVGGVATFIDFLLYMVLSRYMDISIAKFLSMSASSILSYFANKCWTFSNNERSNMKYITKYYVTFFVNMSVNLLINRCVYYICVSRFLLMTSLSKCVAFVIATGVAMIVNYVLQKCWVFKQKEEN